jgi:hypothetical protein
MMILPRVRSTKAAGARSQVADGRDKRGEPPIAEASGQLRQLFAVGLDDEEDGPAVAGVDGRRIGDGDEGAAGELHHRQ